MNIYQKINTVMKAVTYIKKDATIQGYKAVTHDQIVAHCRKHFVESGIVIYPEQIGESATSAVIKAGGEMTNMIRYEARYNIHFVNIDDPADRITAQVEAHANDNGDKAPGKALTYATKAAILKVLCMETGENDEGRITEVDASDDIAELEKCESLKELQGAYLPMHKKYANHKAALAEVIAAKDKLKRKLEGTTA